MKKETERILKELKEEFYTNSESSITSKYREIFVNPSRKEIADLVEEYGRNTVRFIADKRKKKVYVAASDVFHSDIAKDVGLEGYYFFMNTFAGTGKFTQGKILVTDWTDYFNDEEDDILRRLEELSWEIIEGDYDWLERYNFALDLIEGTARDEIAFIEDYFKDKTA
jgi:hypothetical protein